MNNLVYLVWLKATPIQGLPPNEWRRDRNGNVIRWSEYGRLTQYGWEIDHSIPKSRNGSNDISNLSPMRWRENREKSGKTLPQYELDTFIKNYREAMQRAKN